MVISVETAHAQPYLYKVAPCGTKEFTTAAGVVPVGTIGDACDCECDFNCHGSVVCVLII